MKKRIVSLFIALVLLFSSCFVTTNVFATNTIDSVLTLENSSSTNKKLVFTGTDSVDINSNIKKFKANDDNEGIFFNLSKNADLAFVKKDGKWVINFPKDVTVTQDTTIMVKGVFTYGENSVRFNTITVKYTGSAWEVIDNPNDDSIEYNRTLNLLYANDENKYGTSGGIFLSGNDGIEGDTSWGTFISFNDGDNNGVFLNGTKTAVQMKKISQYDWYVCLSDASVTAVKNDVVTIKGAITHKGKTAVFNEVSFIFDGTTWAVKTDAESCKFDQYYINDSEKYGTTKGIYLKSNDNIEYDTSWGTFISFDGGAESGVFLNGTKTNVKMKKFTATDWYVCLSDENIVAQKGDKVAVKGSITYKSNKVSFEEIVLEFNGTTWDLANDPNLETGRTLTLGTQLDNQQNGIHLVGDDSLKAPGWTTNINPQIGDNNGVFVNGKKTEVFLKKYEDNKWYVCLSDAGITAKKNDVVAIKGIFIYGTSKISFNEAEFLFNGTTWVLNKELDIESGRTLSLGTQLDNQQNGVHLVGDDSLKAPGWQPSIYAEPGDDNGVFFNGKRTEAFLKKYEENKWYVCLSDVGITAKSGDIVTVKGLFVYGNKGISFKEAKFKFNGVTWTTTAEIKIETGRTLSLGTQLDNQQNGVHLVGDDSLKAPGWQTNIYAQPGEDNGVFFNGKRTEAFLKKYEENKWYVCLSDVGITAKSGDIVTVKGIFVYGNKGISFKEAKFKFNGVTWTTTAEIKIETGRTLSLGTQLDNQQNGVHLVGDDSLKAPGWQTNIYAEPGEDNGVFFNGKKTDVFLKKYEENKWYVCLSDAGITAKKGDVVTVKGIFVYGNKGISFKEAEFLYNGATWVLKNDPNLETGRSLYLDTNTDNPQKGIYLIGDDSLKAPGWGENIYAQLGDDSGVFLNGKRTEVFLKKYEGKKWYVCLSDASITAKKNDVVIIKGVFIYGEYKVSFNEATFTFNGSVWEEKKDNSSISLDFVDLLNSSKYNKTTKKWEIYLSTTKALPGADEVTAFNVLMKIGNINKTIKCKKSSKQHSFFFEIDSSLIPYKPSKEVVLTILGGKYDVVGGKERIKIESDTQLYFLNGNVSLISSKIDIDEKNITLSIDRSNQAGGTKKGIYLTANDKVPYDLTWATNTVACEGKTNGVFLNGVKTDVYLKKYDKNKYYVCLSDVNVEPSEGDTIVIKGAFKTNKYISSYKSYTLQFKDGYWLDGTEPETKFTKVNINGYDDSVSKYNISLDRWELYFTTKEKLPGDGDQRFDSVTLDINGTEYIMPCYHASHKDTFFLIIESDKLKRNETAKITVSGKAKSEDQTIGMDVQKFTFYTNKYGVSLKGYPSAIKVKEKNVILELDTVTFGWTAGTESGINLLTNDGFEVDDTWLTPIRPISYDENSGIFYNGKRIDAYLKKHTKNCIYLDIAAGGVFAKDKDKITIKGTFALNGYGVSYKEQSFYFNGQSWSTTYKKPIKKQKVDLTPIGIKKSSSYNPERKAWDIYVQVDGAIPGTHDYEYKSLICEVNGKSIEVNVYKVEDSLVFFVPDTILPKNAKDGSAITLKAGVASDNYGIYEINFTKDYTAYIFHKAVSAIKPTDNTKYLDISVPGLLRTCTYTEEYKVWQLFFKVDEKFDVEDGTQYYDLPVKLNGKHYEEITVFRSGECLYISIPDTVLPPDAQKATLTIEKGGKAVANSGWNGIRFKNDLTVYMFDGVWNNVEFTEHQETDLTLKHLNFCSYNQDVSRWDIYVNVDKEIPGNNWFEYFDGLTAYLNGKKYTTYANKAESGNNRLLYISLDEAVFGKFKDGDVIYIPKGITYSCGGYKLNNMQDFYLQYLNGTWFEYYETDITAPEAVDTIWENGRIDGYIPVQEEKGIMFSNVAPMNIIKSVEDVKDITFTFETTKMLSYNEELPTNSIILRGQPLTEGMDISETALYGYNICFSYVELNEFNTPNNPDLWGTHSQEISVWKNGINYALIDQYRMSYNWKKENHPFFEYDKKYKYTVSIYNVEEDICVIEIYCNDELVMRVVDRGSDDPLDPVYNSGQLQIYAACPQYFYSPAVELESLEVSQKECYIGEQVRVSATYPAILEGAEYTVDGEGAEIKNGVFIAKKPGTYTVTGKYNGKSKGNIQIKVSEKPVKTNAVEEKSEFPIIPVAIGGGVVVVVAAVLLIIFLKRKKNKIAG